MNNIIDKLKKDWKETSWNYKLLAVIGGCSVLIDIMTPLAICLFWSYYFNISDLASTLILIIGGFATFFRAFKVGFLKGDIE